MADLCERATRIVNVPVTRNKFLEASARGGEEKPLKLSRHWYESLKVSEEGHA